MILSVRRPGLAHAEADVRGIYTHRATHHVALLCRQYYGQPVPLIAHILHTDLRRVLGGWAEPEDVTRAAHAIHHGTHLTLELLDTPDSVTGPA